jgi:hypothetical protein
VRDTHLAHWSHISEKPDRRSNWDSKGFSQLHPIPFRFSRGNAAKLLIFSSADRGRSVRLLARASWRSFWQEQPLDQQA